ncbi:hypothetical protein BRADO3013 [Bradyrhizobium sp. ORS 278]|nr:hypothetical protein BRADO3013 [Bradyrhizobium sp. ORS 278]
MRRTRSAAGPIAQRKCEVFGETASTSSCPGFIPGIRVVPRLPNDVDGRGEAGQDGWDDGPMVRETLRRCFQQAPQGRLRPAADHVRERRDAGVAQW